MKRLLATILLGTVAAHSAAGQTGRASVSGAGDSERYVLRTGSVVSASAPRPEKGSRTLGARGQEIYADMSEALAIIDAKHVDGPRKGRAELIEGAIDGMLASLDPHSEFLGKPEFEELMTEQRSEYSGIGATIATYGPEGRTATYIISTFENSPARRAGLRFGDRIVEVDGRDVSGLETEAVRALVKGATGSAVNLRVERISGERVAIRLRRMTVQQRSVPSAYLLRPGIGYIDATEGFTETTEAEIRSALNALKRQGMSSLILDLRNNPGGLLNQAVKVSELFLPAGKLILTQRGRGPEDNRSWISRNTGAESLPLVVLVNPSTASAAEIVAGALQDHDRALIIGQATFGKGLVQSVIGLDQGAGLTLTTGRYFTPSGRSVQRDYEGLDQYSYLRRQSTVRSQGPIQVARTDAGRILLGGNGIIPEIELPEKGPPSSGDAPASESSFFKALEVLANHSARAHGSHRWLGDGTAWQELRLNGSGSSAMRFGCIPRAYVDDRGLELELRKLLALADVGQTGARRVLVESDPLVLRAIEEIRKGLSRAILTASAK